MDPAGGSAGPVGPQPVEVAGRHRLGAERPSPRPSGGTGAAEASSPARCAAAPAPLRRGRALAWRGRGRTGHATVIVGWREHVLAAARHRAESAHAACMPPRIGDSGTGELEPLAGELVDHLRPATPRTAATDLDRRLQRLSSITRSATSIRARRGAAPRATPRRGDRPIARARPRGRTAARRRTGTPARAGRAATRPSERPTAGQPAS